MINFSGRRARAPTGHLDELHCTEAASVIYLRLWSEGDGAQAQIARDFNKDLGMIDGNKAFRALETLWQLLTIHKRRALTQYSLQCQYVGVDECCLENFINIAGEGKQADAILIAKLLVKTHVANFLTSCAPDFGLALKQMKLKTPEYLTSSLPETTTIH